MHNPATGKKAMMYVIVGVLLMVALLVGADASGLLAHDDYGRRQMDLISLHRIKA